MSRTACLALLLAAGCGTESTKPAATTGTTGTTDTGACTPQTVWADADGDGFGDPLLAEEHCAVPAGFVDNALDCDDTDADERPEQVWYRDADSDGAGDPDTELTSCLRPLGHLLVAGDCDDLDATKGPTASWYLDQDADGYGDPDAAVDSCGDLTGAVPTATDCDDSDWLVHPTALEVCDGLDNDCDGLTDDDDPDTDALTKVRTYEDLDGDGHGTDVYLGDYCPGSTAGATVADDCDDTDPLVHPGHLDYAGSLDQDCDGEGEVVMVGTHMRGVEGFEGGAFGFSIDARDIDGDGQLELLASATNAGDAEEGVVGLLEGATQLGLMDGWPEADGAQLFTGAEADGELGYSVRFVGDWDGDGIEDFAIGAVDVADEGGAVYILSTADTSGGVDDALFSMVHPEATADLGQAILDLGDVTGDGLADVLVSARRDSRVGPSQGSVTLIPGGGTEGSVVVSPGTSTYDQFGYAMSHVGDVDGDGIADVAIGASGGDELIRNGGETSVFSLPDLADTITADHALVIFLGPDESGLSGRGLAGPGDVDGDGYDDVFIGAPGYDATDAEEDEGSAFVALGSGTGWASTSLTDAHLRIDSSVPDLDLGYYLGAPGDIDADGLGDLIIGAHRWDDDRENVGQTYGILGRTASGTLTVPADADLVLQGADAYDNLARGIAPAGDVDGDGFDDFFLGSSGFGRTGAVFLIEGGGHP